MPRPHKCRFINGRPRATVFKPGGVPGHQLETVEIGLDELEALRLADLEGLYQAEAAARMGISRPTFSRLVEAARHKVAEALLRGKMIVFQGGQVVVGELRSFECLACAKTFQQPRGTGPPKACPACGSAGFRRVGEGPGRGRCRRGRGGGGSPGRHGRGRRGADRP